jgi:dolichyl-phosphate-mannose--protein O-mannosyl transferase
MNRRPRMIGLGLITFFLTLLAMTGLSWAEEVTSSAPTPAVPGAVTLQPYVVALLAGTITPLVTGLITKLSAAPGVKAIVSLVLVAVVTVINTVVTNDGHFLVRDLVILFFTTLVAHMASYFQIWEPIGKPGTTWTQEVTPTVGIG